MFTNVFNKVVKTFNNYFISKYNINTNDRFLINVFNRKEKQTSLSLYYMHSSNIVNIDKKHLTQFDTRQNRCRHLRQTANGKVATLNRFDI